MIQLHNIQSRLNFMSVFETVCSIIEHQKRSVIERFYTEQQRSGIFDLPFPDNQEISHKIGPPPLSGVIFVPL